MNETRIRGRFAPSPSGRLHVGNMISSLLAWLDARSLGGEIIFRLEDLDPDRSTYENACYMADDLEWLGLDWDAGWQPGTGAEYAQSNRTLLYEAQFRRFEEQGLVYPCYCSRAQRLAASAPHPGELLDKGCGCRTLTSMQKAEYDAAGKRCSYKIHVDDSMITFPDVHCGIQMYQLKAGADDFIIRRADGVYAYQLAVSYDDAVMGVNRVVRGRDILDSTPKQLWLFEKMDYPPPTYCHAPLLVSADGRKMSKRNGDLCMRELRKHHTPQELCGKFAWLAGLLDTPEPITPKELVPLFDWKKVSSEKIILPEELFR